MNGNGLWGSGHLGHSVEVRLSTLVYLIIQLYFCFSSSSSVSNARLDYQPGKDADVFI